MSRVALCVVVFSIGMIVSSASAQIIYEPVQYQYEAGGTTYYYGGNNPAVHDYAREPYSAGGTWGRTGGYVFVGGDIRGYREVVTERPRVFTDAVGRGMINARPYGFTADDARNEALAGLPRYFVKRDLLRGAQYRDGAWRVPARSAGIRVYKSNGQRIDTAPATMPRPLMIIPKDQLLKPKTPDKLLASAR